MSEPSERIYRKIIGRMEAGKLPIYPRLIREKAVKRYKAEKQAELRRRQAATRAKIATERKARARREAAERSAIYEARETRRKKTEAQAEALKDVRTGSWVKIAPDGSVSGAGEAAYSPSEAKAMGFKWGTTVRKKGKAVFVPLPKRPTEAQYHGILQEKVARGHYAHRPKVEKRIKKKIAMGGKEYGITAPAWAAGYMKEYQAKAHAITQAYRKAARSTKTPSGYELKGITLAKEDKGLRFEYVGKKPVPVKAAVAPAPPKHKPTPKPTVRGVQGVGGYGTDFAIAESIPMDEPVKPKPKDMRPDIFKRQLPPSIFGTPEGALAGAREIKETIRGGVVSKGKDIFGWKPQAERNFEMQEQLYIKATAGYERTPEGAIILPTKPTGEYTEESKVIIAQQEALTKRAEQLSDPLYMAKERTKGMRMAPVVTKAYEFGAWWGKTVTPKVEQFAKISKGVYALQAERGRPSIFAGAMLLPKEQPIIPTFQKGMVKGISDVPIMAAEVGYAGEYIYKRPKEAAIIAPGVATYMVKGMAKEAVEHPVEFAGRMATMAIITGGIGKAVRSVMPKYIHGVKLTDTGRISYKGVGIRGIKEPHPIAGVWKETVRTPEVTATQRAFVLGKEYPALRYLKGIKEAEFPTPELGLGARAFGKQRYTEAGVGKTIKYERIRTEGLWGKDYFLPERIPKTPEPVIPPKLTALPPPKPVLWKRGATTLAERVTALKKTKQPKPIKKGGVRIEKPDIPTYIELALGRAYRIEKGYRALQIGEYPTHLKILGLGRGVPKFGKGIEELIHPFRRKVPSAYEPSMLDYQVPRGLLTGSPILDITRAKIRPSERPPSPIENLYEHITPEEVFQEAWIERRPSIGIEGILKPIESYYLKFAPEGDLIPQSEIAIARPKRKIEVATMPEISFDFKVITDTTIKVAADTHVSAKTIVERTAKETKRARDATKEGIGKIEALGKTHIRKGIDIGVGLLPIIKTIPTHIPRRVDKEKPFGFVIPGYEAAFKPFLFEAIAPKYKTTLIEKEKEVTFITPKFRPVIDIVFEARFAEPIAEPVPAPIIPPSPTITTFAEPPPPFIPFAGDEDKKKKKRKLREKKQWEWLEEFTVQRPTELHFGAIESGIPKVSKVVMLPQVSMAGIVKAIKPKTKKTPKKRTTKTKEKNKRIKKKPKDLKGKKTNRRSKKK